MWLPIAIAGLAGLVLLGLLLACALDVPGFRTRIVRFPAPAERPELPAAPIHVVAVRTDREEAA